MAEKWFSSTVGKTERKFKGMTSSPGREILRVLGQNHTFPIKAEEWRWYLLVPTLEINVWNNDTFEGTYKLPSCFLSERKTCLWECSRPFSFICLSVVHWFIRKLGQIDCGRYRLWFLHFSDNPFG